MKNHAHPPAPGEGGRRPSTFSGKATLYGPTGLLAASVAWETYIDASTFVDPLIHHFQGPLAIAVGVRILSKPTYSALMRVTQPARAAIVRVGDRLFQYYQQRNNTEQDKTLPPTDAGLDLLQPDSFGKGTDSAHPDGESRQLLSEVPTVDGPPRGEGTNDPVRNAK